MFIWTDDRRNENGSAGSRNFQSVLGIAQLFAICALAVAVIGGSSCRAAGAELEAGQKAYLTGQYDESTRLAREGVTEGIDRQEWQLLLCRSLLARGQYPEALAAVTNALRQNAWSIRLQWQAREVYRANGDAEKAAKMAEDVLQTVAGQPRGYRDAASMVAFGQAALAAGADPKRVLDTVFDAAKRADPALRDTYLACGNLALDKHDYALAARHFEEGLKKLPDDPDLHYGRARAFATSDPEMMLEAVHSALEKNSNHVDCLLLVVDRGIDAEDYTGVERLLDRVKQINPVHPRSWAYRAVLAHLRNQPEAEKVARANALKSWRTNPEVDWLIGKKLSQNYRFAEGAAYQRRALELDPDYLPAKAQLSRDLLRLGQDEQGWKLAEEVQKQDGYDTEAYNLMALRDVLQKYRVLTNEHFIVRMTPREAELYGERVLELLDEARSKLTEKYGPPGAEIGGPLRAGTAEVGRGVSTAPSEKTKVVVEIFAEQKDFEVRTFGMPGNPGYLGVCFGNLITANSPASHEGTPVNWEAVLWHEFCHVVTLQLTRNKMPRWLSEGISVFEELQTNPAWGQTMNPRYREMILEGELAPISKLSAAFLSPPTPLHLQFAYFQSSLVVEFLVGRFGNDRLRTILLELAKGTEINQALETHTTAMAQLEKDFEAFARNKAEALAAELDWQRPERGERNVAARGAPKPSKEPMVEEWKGNKESLEAWLTRHPRNFYALMEQAQTQIEEKRFEEAKAPLKVVFEAYPEQRGERSAAALLAGVHRALGETNAERRVLEHLVQYDGEAVGACARLIELDGSASDWPGVVENAKRYLAINPLVAVPYRYLARATEQTGENKEAIRAYRALLQLDPLDPAETNFRLARALHREGNPAAKRHVLDALEEAPRHRGALELLMQMKGEAES